MLLQTAWLHSFLWLSSIPLYIYNEYILCVCVYDIQAPDSAKEGPQPDAEPPPITNIQPDALRSHPLPLWGQGCQELSGGGLWKFKVQT